MHSESTELRRRIGAALSRIETAVKARQADADDHETPIDGLGEAESLRAKLGRAVEEHRRETEVLSERIDTLQGELELAKSENARLRESLEAGGDVDGSDDEMESLRARLKLLSEERTRDLETLDEILLELGRLVGEGGEDA